MRNFSPVSALLRSLKFQCPVGKRLKVGVHLNAVDTMNGKCAMDKNVGVIYYDDSTEKPWSRNTRTVFQIRLIYRR